MKFNNVTKIALITFFSSFYLYSHVGTLYMQERGLNLFQANAITSIIIGASFLAEVPTGIIADQLGRKNAMIAALVLQLLGELLYLFARSYTLFIWIAIIAGIGFAFQSGTLEAIVYDSLPHEGRDEQMKRAMGLKGMAYQCGFAMAPLLGSFLVPVFTINRFLFTVFLTSCSVGVGLMIAFTLDEPISALRRDTHGSLAILRDGFGHIMGSRVLIWLTLIGMFTQSFHGSLVGLYQPYFADFEISTFWMGIAFSAGALLASLSERYAFLMERFFGYRPGFLTATILPGALYLLMAFSSTPTWLFAYFILTYGTSSLKNPLFSAYQNQFIESQNRATVLSILSLIASLYGALMTLLIGWVADIKVNYSFALIGGLIVIGSLVLRVDRIGRAINSGS